MTKIYVTKYALTAGICEHEAKICESGTMAVVKHGNSYPMYFHGNDWHLTKEKAIERSEEMRIKKLQSLDKQIRKISEIVFERGDK